jgi:vitamin B12 transporter
MAAEGEVDVLDEVVVTATGRPEARSNITGTIQVIDQQRIESSSAKSMTDLLAENAVGFFSEWTPGQTSITIRGGRTDAQGKDSASEVLVLINGRRAGTANISKLSPADVERVEIVRGPSSVVYGSQNIGGVINIIMKNGRTAPGTFAEAAAGSADLLQGKIQTGGQGESLDWYLGLSSGKKGDYHSGRGGTEMDNTSWKRRGVTAGLGVQFNPDHRLDLSMRTDGVYDAGFRGSRANIYAKDDRYNQSADLSYSGKTADGKYRWLAHAYSVHDVEDYRWPFPMSASTQSDHSKRRLNIQGLRFQPQATLWKGNDLLLGWDWEKSRLRSDRKRVAVPGKEALVNQQPPYDNNQTERVSAFYFEDSQKLLDDRLTIRGGVRRTQGTTRLDWTPHLKEQRPRSEDYRQTTYSVGGTYRVTDGLSLRGGFATGFRAPTATELAGDYIAVGSSTRYVGNPSLKPETSRQFEVGGSYTAPAWRLDLALFQNIIKDRINSKKRGSTDINDYVNNSGDVVVRGIELQGNVDLLRKEDTAWRWSIYGNGAYNFTMRDEGASPTANTDRLERAYKYVAVLGTRFGQSGVAHDWSIKVEGLLRGPMWIGTEESFVPGVEPSSSYIHRKGSFTVVNVRGDVVLQKGVKFYAAVQNLFNVNEHPILFGLDDKPYTLAPNSTNTDNGKYGTSMPGREFQIGIQALF